MDKPQIAQQVTTTTLPLGTARPADAPEPTSLQRGVFGGPLQWTLEGRGWQIVRPLVDFALLCSAVVIALHGVDRVTLDSTSGPLLLLPPLVMLLFKVRGLYRRRLRALLLDGLLPVFSAVSVAAMSVGTIGLFVNGEVPPQYLWVRAWLLSAVGVAVGRAVLAGSQRWARGRRLVGKPVLIVGAGHVGAHVARRLESRPEYGLLPIGFLDSDPLSSVGGTRREVPVLGTLDDLDKIASRTGVGNVIVAFASESDAHVSRLIQRCESLGLEVSVVPRMFDTINDRVSYDAVGGLPLLTFNTIDPNGLQFAVKHALDRVVAFAILVLLSPVIVVAALAVVVSSPGPVLFRQRRVGRDGKLFDLYKFRSMRAVGTPGAGEEAEPPLAFLLGAGSAPGGVEGEDRRTRVGRLLRRTSVDELPQLFNVLQGDMSLVGPRPERPEFVEIFRQDILRYGDRHRVKAGITGWAQVHGLRGRTSLADRVEWDNFYIAHWSLGLDLKILAMTLSALFHDAE